MQQRAMIILGMHRSGTSALAGCLEEAGVYLGHVVRSSGDTPKGWCENPLITLLHDSLLRTNHGTWYEPPPAVKWQPRHRLMRDTIIDSFDGHFVWGFKDPRTLLVFEGWLERLGETTLIGVVRHPALVAQSLHVRNKFSLEQGMLLWWHYNMRLWAWSKLLPMVMLSFDDLVMPFTEQVELTGLWLGLPNAHERRHFVPEARHTAPPRIRLPPWVTALYESLVSEHKAWVGKTTSWAARVGGMGVGHGDK